MIDNAIDAELYARVMSVLQKVVHKAGALDNVTLETRVHEDLGLDSIRLLELVFELEDEFSIHMHDGWFEQPRTIADLVALVQKKSA